MNKKIIDIPKSCFLKQQYPNTLASSIIVLDTLVGGNMDPWFFKERDNELGLFLCFGSTPCHRLVFITRMNHQDESPG
jgi:hypothetical protein